MATQPTATTVTTTTTTYTTKAILSKDVRHEMAGDGPMGRFNTHLALMITKHVGSMWCAYLFALLAFISLPSALATGSPIVIISWIAQTFLQLVLLPIIIVGQNVQSAASDKRAEVDSQRLLEVHDHLDVIHQQVLDHVTASLDRIEKAVVGQLENIQAEDHAHIEQTQSAVMSSMATQQEALADLRQMLALMQQQSK